VSAGALERTLRDLPRVGTLIKDRGYRQVWQFEQDGRAYFLKFYPKLGPRDAFRRFFRGSPALAEFTRLQALQRAGVPAPRAVAVMVGFVLKHQRGDAVILEAIEPSIPLDEHLNQRRLAGEPVTDHRALARQVVDLIQQLGRAKLGHEDLHLGNFLLHQGKLYLLDGYAVRTGGMRLRDLMMLGHSVSGFATTSDLLRGWRALGPGGALPRRNPVSALAWSRFGQLALRENRYFGRLRRGAWCGVFYQRAKQGQRWSLASRGEVSRHDWEAAWDGLLTQMQADALPVLKRTRSGDVLATELTLGGQRVPVIVKRPRRRYWYRYLNEIGRGSRPRRAWKKAWAMLARGLPVAWPLLLMERQRAGYVVDAVLVSERVPGPTLAELNLGVMDEGGRQTLLQRAGRILRQIERLGYSHFDAKPSNWIAYPDALMGPTPVMIDVDGIRRRRWIGLGIGRLLRGMQENPSYTPADSLALCRGYAPAAKQPLEPAPEAAVSAHPATQA
jgi:tRNA A-37 threonylcarbamoyl transferase component Bud32